MGIWEYSKVIKIRPVKSAMEVFVAWPQAFESLNCKYSLTSEKALTIKSLSYFRNLQSVSKCMGTEIELINLSWNFSSFCE